MALQAGTLLGSNIELESQLGQGGMGEVWIAQNRTLQSRVAVKVLRGKLLGEPEALARFEQEARAVARIDSPHVVKVFDLGYTPEGEPYIVMELLQGRDLLQVIDQEGTLSIERTVTIVQQLCRALGRAHALGLVHRDIKPANVFLQESDGQPFVKVLDFGVARVIGEAHMNMTSTGALMGTPYYMSPEQLVDPRSVDARSDLWSVAILAYACLLGALPFQGETVGALSLAVHGGTFALPSETNADLPRALDAFFQRALSVDPDGRYADADQLAIAFAAASGSAPSSASPSTNAPSNAPAHVAHASHASPITQPSALNASTANAFAQTQNDPAPSKRSPLLAIGIVLAVLAVGGASVALLVPWGEGDTTPKKTASTESDTKKKKGKNKKKKKKGKEKKEEAPAPEPDETAAPPPAPAASSASAEPTPPPAPSSTPPQTPRPAPPAPPPTQRWAPANIKCATAGKGCIPCCTGKRDKLTYVPASGNKKAECLCMRPICNAGESWATHACMTR